MKITTTLLFLALSLAGCDATDFAEVPDGSVASDALVQRLEDAQASYTSKGVYANLGTNRCYASGVPSQGGGWDPSTSKCYPPSDPKVTSGLCGTYGCGTYAPGTLLVWDSVDPRYRYWVGEGVVCLPNDVPRVVPCT